MNDVFTHPSALSGPQGGLDSPGFFARLAMAFVLFFRVLFKPDFARAVLPLYRAHAALPERAVEVKRPDPTQVHRSALFLLSMLQREGRLLDFLEEDVAAHSDAEVGAAARVVHEGCRRLVRQYLPLAPVMTEPEGASVTVPAGFDAQRIRLTGNVAGQGPFSGSLRHHGWVATAVQLPEPPGALDPKVLAPAEVELS